MSDPVRLRFTLATETPEEREARICGQPRVPGGKVRCEMPKDHEIELEKAGWWRWHTGRDRAGRWHRWR